MVEELYTKYFGFDVGRTVEGIEAIGERRVLLSAVTPEGGLLPIESRKGNVSGSSRNYRLELAALREVQESGAGRPVVVFLKVGPRDYLYEVLDSEGEAGRRLLEFASERKKSLPSGPLAKCRADFSDFAAEFPDLPIVNVPLALLEGCPDDV